MTKSFQSIRQLMARVMGKPAADAQSQREYSTLGLEPSTNGLQNPTSEVVPAPHSSVFVEAPLMTESEPEEVDAPHCSTDVDLQTADTQQLHPVEPATPVAGAEAASDPEENEIEQASVSAPVFVSEESSFAGVSEMNEISSQSSTTLNAGDHLGDAFLDLGDFQGSPADHAAEDSILDLDGETTLFESPAAIHIAEAPAPAERRPFVEPFVESVPEVEVAAAPVETEEWASAPAVAIAEVIEPEPEAVETVASAGQVNLADLSPEMIDAIARRVVAQLSDKVVREIAWEVVPELAELLIKEKLEKES